MVEFMKKAMDWLLEKEEAAAKNAHIKVEDIDKQIQAIEDKKSHLMAEYDDNITELNHIISRLKVIKSQIKE